MSREAWESVVSLLLAVGFAVMVAGAVTLTPMALLVGVTVFGAGVVAVAVDS